MSVAILKKPQFLSALAAGGNNRYLEDFVEGNFLKFYFVVYGFESFDDGTYWLWQLCRQWNKRLIEGYGLEFEYGSGMLIPRGYFKSDEEIIAMMADTIKEGGYSGYSGVGISVRASEWPKDGYGRCIGLFSNTPKTDDDLVSIYQSWVEKYMLVFIEEPVMAYDGALYDKIREGGAVLIAGGRNSTPIMDEVCRVGMGDGIDAIVVALTPRDSVSAISIYAEKIRESGCLVFCDCEQDGGYEDKMVDLTIGIGADLCYEFGQGPYANRYLELVK